MNRMRSRAIEWVVYLFNLGLVLVMIYRIVSDSSAITGETMGYIVTLGISGLFMLILTRAFYGSNVLGIKKMNRTFKRLSMIPIIVLIPLSIVAVAVLPSTDNYIVKDAIISIFWITATVVNLRTQNTHATR